MSLFARKWLGLFSILIIGFLLSQCGTASDSETTHYQITLTVTGLSGSLESTVDINGYTQTPLTFTADGSQTFSALFDPSSHYAVLLTTVPSGQACSIENATGKLSANKTLTVTCSATTHTVSGVVTGLASGENATLYLNNGTSQTVTAGAFTFDKSLPNGSSYSLTVTKNGPGKICSITNGSGTVSADVTDVMVSCATATILFKQNVSDGNLGGRTGADATCASGAAALGSAFTCDATRAFISVSVSDQARDLPTRFSTRSDAPVYATNLDDNNSLVLIGTSWADILDGSWTTNPSFGWFFSGSNSNGTVASENCSGFTTGADNLNSMLGVNDQIANSNNLCRVDWGLLCACMTQDYQLGGTVSGLTSAKSVGVTLTDGSNRTEALTLVGNGTYYFGTSFVSGDTYSVAITTEPAGESCTITNAAGTISSTSATALAITCAEDEVSIGGTVTGLSGTVVLGLDAGAQTKSVTTSGAFTFGTNIANGTAYTVTIVTNPTDQTCTVTNGSGTATADVSSVTVTCSNNPVSIGGTVSGLSGTVVLGLNSSAQTASVTTSGSFTFGTDVADGTAYTVVVVTHPTTQTCTVVNGTGTATADVSNITVTCTNDISYLFPTDSATTADLGGRSGADTLCRTTRTNSYSSLTCNGGVRALLTVSATDEIADMPTNYSVSTADPIYYAVNSQKVADNWTDLLDGTIDSALDVTWWSGSDDTGSVMFGTCTSWTVANMDSTSMGDSGMTDFMWIDDSGALCNQSHKLMCLCFQ